MPPLIKKNLTFFIPFGLWLIAGACLLAYYPKGEWVLFFAEERMPQLDQIFVYITQLGEEIMYAFFALIFFFIRPQYSLLIVFLGFTNLIISLILKALFAQPRPAYVYWIKHDYGQISYPLGIDINVSMSSSFPSGHTISAFGLYCFIALILTQKKWGFPLLLIALLVGFSRIILTQHFLQDVYAGSIVGVLIALSLHHVQRNNFYYTKK